MSNTFTSKVSGRMSSRGWAIALGIGAIALAAILLIVYLDRYRARVGSENAPTPVLVAKQLIPKGTSGTVIASQGMYAPTTLPRKEVEVGAIADPSYLSGWHNRSTNTSCTTSCAASPQPTTRAAAP